MILLLKTTYEMAFQKILALKSLTMYGLILQNMVEYIQNKHGDNMWKKVKEQLNLEVDVFPAGETYPEAQVGKMGKTAMKILSMKDEEFYEGMGKYFVTLAYWLFAKFYYHYLSDNTYLFEKIPTKISWKDFHFLFSRDVSAASEKFKVAKCMK